MGNQHEREDHRTDLKTLLDSGMLGMQSTRAAVRNRL